MAAPMTTTHTGAAYFDYITRVDSDRRARAAFQDLAVRLAPPGALLFDFGAGPGIDARYFAECGFTVRAYDVDAHMCEFFAGHCRDLIDQRRITLETGSYREFIDRPVPASERRADLVVSNFAPLNLVPDARELFAKFHALTAPHGRVLASVINPWFIGDMRHLWWWRIAPRLWRDGHFFMPGPQAPHTRRPAAAFGVCGEPYFKLTQVLRGLPARGGHAAAECNARPRRSDPWFRLAAARFMFLLFERTQ